MFIKLNRKRCIGCHACEVLCKIEKGLRPDLYLCKIRSSKKRDERGDLKIAFSYENCTHCKRLSCVSSCKSGAVKKKDEDNIVYLDYGLCNSCGECLDACKRGIRWDSKERKPLKCDLCMERIDNNLLPVCVDGCCTSALTLVRG